MNEIEREIENMIVLQSFGNMNLSNTLNMDDNKRTFLQHGMIVQTSDSDLFSPIKQKFGLPDNVQSLYNSFLSCVVKGSPLMIFARDNLLVAVNLDENNRIIGELQVDSPIICIKSGPCPPNFERFPNVL